MEHLVGISTLYPLLFVLYPASGTFWAFSWNFNTNLTLFVPKQAGNVRFSAGNVPKHGNENRRPSRSPIPVTRLLRTF